MVYLLGDFNTQVGMNRDRWHSSLGKFGVGEKIIMATDFCSFVGITT